MMRTTIMCATIALFSFSCDNQTESGETTQEAENTENPVTQANENTSSEVLDKYILLKNALVESDAETAGKMAGELASVAPEEIAETARSISGSNNLEEQRQAFFTLSNAMYAYVKSNPSDQTVYWQYCPMARENQGANWLSMESEILNPYFGDAMLNCGAVEEEL